MSFLQLATKINGFNDALMIALLGFVIVLAVLAVLAIFVKLLSSVLKGGKKKNKNSENEQAAPTPVAPAPAPVAPAPVKAEEAPTIPYIPGYVVLDGTSEQDAAVIMAITSHKTGIDLNRLQFNSIKRLNQDPVLENVSEQDAAVIMAVTCNKLGLEPENLIFNSIKLVED